MKNFIKLVITFCLISILLLGTTINCFASERKGYISDGYTEDGIHYYIYKCVSTSDNNLDNSLISPRIVVSKLIEDYEIVYEGYITPPNTFNYSQFDNGYNITLSGTLNLQSYIWNDYPVRPKCTIAHYRGYVFGNL